ncbi:MAG: lytic transglycosylase domain-containing protein, partial [Myxococcota bacterium]
APLAERHGDAYPWLPRAKAWLELGDERAAGHALYEAFLAWREAKGHAIRYAGAPTIARGDARPGATDRFTTRNRRAALGEEARAELASIGEALGEYGVATGFAGRRAVDARPRAYEGLVLEAAARHGLDPNLLFAVMRVESVYQKEIVSYAGAIGLLQIMPRTGTLIARTRGIEGFHPEDLLDPGTNLDFGAWYLRSLLDRFDGHVPLAVAAYNGGPHNVRLWLRQLAPGAPLDVFAEHVPFIQTHRYVRRVLGHYQAYREQEGLAPLAFSLDRPRDAVDALGF